MDRPIPKFSFNERVCVREATESTHHLVGQCGIICGITDPNDFDCPDENIVIGYAVQFKNERYVYSFEEPQLCSCLHEVCAMNILDDIRCACPEDLFDAETTESKRENE